MYKLLLVGTRNFEIDVYKIFKYNLDDRIIKIKDKTKLNYDLSILSGDTSLKGLFIKEMLNKLENEDNINEKKILEKAIEIGLEVLE